MNNTKPCSSVSKKEVQKRVKLVDNMAGNVAGSIDDKKILYTELIKLNKNPFQDALKDAGFNLMETLTAVQAINIQSLLRLPTNKVRNLRISLSNLGMNIFPSERKIRKEKAPLVSHISANAGESGTIGLRKTKHDDNVVPGAFIRVKDHQLYIEEIIRRDTSGFNHDGNFDGKWWIWFAGDKGGQHMKFHLEVVNSLKAGSVDNVHIYCMFEATDSVENMWKVWFPYHPKVKKMEGGFRILGREVMIFLGGDYHFLDDLMGHQGSSAS